MLKRHADRFGRHDIRIGETMKLPASLPRPLNGHVDPPHRHGSFQVIAFPVGATRFGRHMAHCITIRSLADGSIHTLAAWLWMRCRDAYGMV